jgi:hypothetical protein
MTSFREKKYSEPNSKYFSNINLIENKLVDIIENFSLHSRGHCVHEIQLQNPFSSLPEVVIKVLDVVHKSLPDVNKVLNKRVYNT